jgi:hypothetical protein
VISFLLDFPQISYMHSSSHPFVLHALLIESLINYFKFTRLIEKGKIGMWIGISSKNSTAIFAPRFNIIRCRRPICYEIKRKTSHCIWVFSISSTIGNKKRKRYTAVLHSPVLEMF